MKKRLGDLVAKLISYKGFALLLTTVLLWYGKVTSVEWVGILFATILAREVGKYQANSKAQITYDPKQSTSIQQG